MAPESRLRILLAEDNPINQKVTLRMLERLGYRADIANNGQEAVDALKQEPYDVILMDMMMPHMDGLEATRHIVAHWPKEERPFIVAVTANVMPGDKERCLNAGMDDYLPKPLRMQSLKTVLDACVPLQTEPSPVLKAAVLPQSPVAAIDGDALNELREMLGPDDPALLHELMVDFLDDAVRLMDVITTSVASGEASKMERAAHTLKSSSAMFGAMAFSDQCKALEYLGKANDLTDVPGKVTQLKASFEHVEAELQGYMRQGQRQAA